MNDRLRNELFKRMDEEQSLRQACVENPNDKQLIDRISEVDRQNTNWLEEIIEHQGLPGKSLVGDDGVQALFLLIQHSPKLEFQKQSLTLMEFAVREEEADPVHLAYLTDRVLVWENKPQIYRTQGLSVGNGRIEPCPIEDKEHVDERRASVGLGPIDEYFKQLNEVYKTNKEG